MPDDEEEEYEDDGGNEMVDMEDDEAQPENDQLQNNKIDAPGAHDENRQPNMEVKQPFTAQNQNMMQGHDPNNQAVKA